MSGPGKFLKTALRIGLPASGYRLFWELEKRTGLKRLRTPAGGVPMPSATVTFDEWLRELPAGHWLLSLRERVGKGPSEAVVDDRAEAALAGRFVLFGRTEISAGDPPRWNLEPFAGVSWPRSHWTSATSAPVGDLRSTWELNRFLHVWDWVAAARELDAPPYAQAFERHVVSWSEANTFRAGVNWASGQELAIRALNLMVGAAAFGGGMSAGGFRRLVELLYWHAFHIESEFGFSQIAVPNNHLIAEAFALAAVGDAFGAFEEAEGWRALGIRTLLHTVPRQFTEDGGYCQASTSYHRFALELLLWSELWFGRDVVSFGDVFANSLDLFEALLNDDGTVANFGPNDGARALPRGSSDARDYRPLAAAMRTRLGRPVDPSWRDACAATLYWTGLHADADTESSAAPARQGSFLEAGLHVLRAGPWSATFRCGPMPVRGGHSDALHVDVRHGDTDVCADRGSYRYLDPRHGDFVEAHAHSGIVVDGQQARELLTRFTWSAGPEPSLDEYDPERGFMIGHFAPHPDFEWTRRVEVSEAGVVVVDSVTPRGRELHEHEFVLHWLLADAFEAVVDRSGVDGACVELGDVTVAVVAHAVVDDRIDISTRVEESSISWYYGSADPAASLLVSATGRGVRFETRFSLR